MEENPLIKEFNIEAIHASLADLDVHSSKSKASAELVRKFSNTVKEEDQEISETEDEKARANIRANKIRRLQGNSTLKQRARAVTIDVDNDN